MADRRCGNQWTRLPAFGQRTHGTNPDQAGHACSRPKRHPDDCVCACSDRHPVAAGEADV